MNQLPEGAPILVVEDDFLIASQAEVALQDAGFTLIGVAASAEEAIRLATVHHPALVIMDIRLAGQRDGVDAAIELFAEHGIRSIFATAHTDQSVIQRAAPANPIAWLQKPYSTESLVATVREALRRSQP
jgi:two-component system, response regulator PdtaR